MGKRLPVTSALQLMLFSLFLVPCSFAQDIERFKSQVVRVVSTSIEGSRQVGSGFLVGLEPEAVYIVTASHVVEGAREVQVEFYNRKNRLAPAKVIGMEAGDSKGLAALLVEYDIPEDLSTLTLDSAIPVQGGDRVQTIGFPRISGVPWAVISGNVVGRKGRIITFSGAVDEGNSGGPLIKEGRVIGIVTEVAGKFAYATPAIIAQYSLEGWGIELGSRLAASPPVPQPTQQPEPDIPVSTNLEGGSQLLKDGTIYTPDSGLVWMVVPELLTWSGAKKKFHEVQRAGETNSLEWHIPSRSEVERLLSQINTEKGGPLSVLEGTFWVDEEKFREINRRSFGKLGLFVTYVDLANKRFFESDETQNPRFNKLLLARPVTP